MQTTPSPDEIPAAVLDGLSPDTVELIHRNLLIGGEPGSGKSGLLNALTAQGAVEDAKPDDCLACPKGCRQCSRDESDCECYEHADLHPDSEPEER
ncbi:hypothetical protein [Actinoplanes aureus]|uniref:Uncharacterized protein n=1 Tax=Actinoplanes aureus TaxID=2792083 RepID=A0A931CKH4_9ACTN|nr:hypothetical protein [Actinoplanes aureus]MBG0568076.1 hypothetical protein [Actinoplanes aureus]